MQSTDPHYNMKTTVLRNARKNTKRIKNHKPNADYKTSSNTFKIL